VSPLQFPEEARLSDEYNFFSAHDKNRDGHMDFKEYMGAMGAVHNHNVKVRHVHKNMF